MRYSEAVKRHKLETKQKILNSILEAADREKNKPSAGSEDGYVYNTETDTSYYNILRQREKETETDKKETITMKNTQINEVRNRKAGFIAAACAALVIGGGAAVYANSMNSLDLAPAASTAASDETSSAPETAKTEEAAPAETADPAAEEGSAAAETKVSFEDLLASAEAVCTGKVLSTDTCYVHDTDGSTKYYIEYVLESPIVYIIESDSIIDHSSADIKIYQPVPEGSAPQLKIGECGIFITSEIKSVKVHSGEGEKAIFVDSPEDTEIGSDVRFTEPFGVFSYIDHKYRNTSNSDEALDSGLTDYVNSGVLCYKDEYSAYNWFDMLGENFTVNDILPQMLTQNGTSPDGMVAGIKWDEKTQQYSIDVCRDSENEYEQYMTGKGYVVSGKEQITNKITEGFDKVDITLDSVTYYPDSTALVLDLTVSAKEGSGFEFSDGTFYRLDYVFENNLQPITWYFNTDALIQNNTMYHGFGKEMHYRIVLDQAGDDGELDFDTAPTYKFTIDSVQIDNDLDTLKGKYEASFKLDPEAVKTLPRARVIDADTKAVNAEIIKSIASEAK